jgi:hypothetical protein
MLTSNPVALLVAPALLGETEAVRVWHAGLSASQGLLQVTIVIEPRTEPPRGSGPARTWQDDCVVSVRNLADGADIPIFFGACGGSEPILIARITEQLALPPGPYVLTIDIDTLDIHYASEFTIG